MARTISLDRTSDNIADNGDRTRTYNVHAADGTIIGYVHEHWHASAFVGDDIADGAEGIVDMSMYKNSVERNRRSFTADAIVGGKKKSVDTGATRARTVANVHKTVFGK